MKTGWSEVALGDLLEQDCHYVSSLEAVSYKKLSVKLYGRGVALDTPANGADVKMEKHQFAKAGQVIVSEIWAKKGAIGIVPAEGHGALITSHFFIFDIRADLVLPGWIRWILKGNYLEPQLSAGAFGSTGYAAVRPSTFLSAKIPFPPLREQQRIVTHFDAIEARLTLAQKLQKEMHLEIEAFTTSLHLVLSGGRTVRLSQLLRLDEEQTAVTADGSYPQIGIRSFGLGLFKKPAISGSDTTYRAFNVLRPGMFVMSQVKGWEGAVGVANDDLNGWFASPEYRTFTCINGECESGYLSHLVTTTWFRNQLASATRGVGARRERVRPEMLLGLKLPFPEHAKQTRAVELLHRLRAGMALSVQARIRKDALLPSLLDRIFRS